MVRYKMSDINLAGYTKNKPAGYIKAVELLQLSELLKNDIFMLL